MDAATPVRRTGRGPRFVRGRMRRGQNAELFERRRALADVPG